MRLDALVAAVAPFLAPPPDLTVSEWAQAHRRLPVASAANGARWNNQTAPYLTALMDAATDPDVTRVVIQGASQTGKSEALHNVVGYAIQHDPSNVLWLVPSFDDAKRRSRGPLADMIRSTSSLRAIVSGRRASRGTAHETESTLLEKAFPGGSLILAGSGTPNSFAGVTARRAIADEFERFAILEEGASDVLLTNRTVSFYDGLTVFISTPLLVDGPIHRLFQTTDQRRYHLHCDACGRADWVTWSDPTHFHITYEDRNSDTARLTCACGAAYDEPGRRRLIAAGEWRATVVPTDPGARGFHLPAMISTLGDVTLSRLVQKWLAARANGPAALMSFVNTSLAEPWEDRGGRVQPHALTTHYFDAETDVPSGGVLITAGVDVQLDRLEVTAVAWGRGGESWVIDAHAIPGDPTLSEVQEALLAALDERYTHPSGVQLPIAITAVDSGYLPEKVAYALAARRPRRIVAVKGVGGRLGEPSILKFDIAKPPAILNVDGLKLEIALGLELAEPGPGFVHLSRRHCDEEYLAQLCAEHRETRRKGGVATMVWVEDRPRNEALDTNVYARAALRILMKLNGARSEDSLFTAVLARRAVEAR